MRSNERHVWPVIFLLVVFLIGWQFSLPLQAQGANAKETLKQYIAQLQYNPNDTALREKIINLALTMKPAPMIPADAEKFGDRAEFAAKNAKTEADFADAAKEYEQALLIAPWVADYYFNLGVVQEKAGKPTEAMHSFQLYLLAAPDASDAREVRKRIAGLEYAIEKLAKEEEKAKKESSPEAIAARERNEFAEWLNKLDGARFISDEYSVGDIDNTRVKRTLDIRGNQIFVGEITTGSATGRQQLGWDRSNILGCENFVIKGYKFDVIGDFDQWKYLEINIGKDGERITVISRWKKSGNESGRRDYYRQN